MIAPHSSNNTTLFVVISGGGYVQVGSERVRVNHGEAVLWPAGEPHGAYTDGSEMRAIVVEFAGADDDWARGVLESGLIGSGETAQRPAARAEGALAPPARPPEEQVTATGEPW